MKQEQLIRERIKVKVLNETGKAVRNVFYLTNDAEKVYYCICGNNNTIFGVASINSKNEIEVII
jgi:hypothetical protein